MKFDSSHFGSQGFGDEDRRAKGSRYSDVKKALHHNAYYLDWNGPDEPGLPTYGVTLGRVLKGILPYGLPWCFRDAAARTLDSNADMRWGPDNRGFRRLVHPNGVCLFGKWKIDEPTPYTGYFEEGKEALIIGRYSTCCSETRRGHNRSLSLVGKLYPTVDENHTELLETANFITQEDLGGMRTDFINDAKLRNAPDTTPWRRGWGAPILLLTGVAFLMVDREPTVRQLYPIAELGKPRGEATYCPQFMQLTVGSSMPRIDGDGMDFRNEIMEHIYGDRGTGKLTFDIEVTDHGTTHGLVIQRRRFPRGWRRIGSIEFTEAVVSYNSDFVIHFQHPPWRRDRNDAGSVIRKPDR